MNDRTDLDRTDLDRTDLDLLADEILMLEAETLAISDYTHVTERRVDASTYLTGNRHRLQ